ncbi:hypothetical protein HELRODRAFT_179161 [Helobdella robusta]|uniref:Uncharacterized protein n=1 Tax=Helobdella robusta TaxID=6412 RepID=T1FEA4_HELRO|nr:hypothetical protein HELRODRAFT_179161 [Helobdella robusta]ESN95690.1 hypothetical protein HELRODRAFT_179161 [Helobdella robusta]
MRQSRKSELSTIHSNRFQVNETQLLNDHRVFITSNDASEKLILLLAFEHGIMLLTTSPSPAPDGDDEQRRTTPNRVMRRCGHRWDVKRVITLPELQSVLSHWLKPSGHLEQAAPFVYRGSSL